MSDIKQAAERLRIADSYGVDMASMLTVDGLDAQLPRDLVAIMRAYLAEHLADDDELVDDAWWARFTNGELSIATPMSGSLTLNWGRIFLDSRCIIKDPTRGQLRKLLAALGANQ